MKSSDIDEVQSLLAKHSQYSAWLQEVAPENKSYIPHDPVVSFSLQRVVVKRDSDIGRELLALLKRYAEDKIATINAELRALGVEP